MKAVSVRAGKTRTPSWGRCFFRCFRTLCVLSTCAFQTLVHAQEEQSTKSVAGGPEDGKDMAQEMQAPKPMVEKLADGKYQIGALQFDRIAREIYLSGRVNMQSGLIEVFACGPRGKLHESVLVLDVVPYHLQVALLLLGLEPGGGLDYQGDPRSPTGDPVEVWVEWERPDSAASSPKVERHRAEDLVYNVAAEEPMTPTPWVFVGSRIVDGNFMAQIEQSLITTFHDPFAILDNPLPTGGDDTLYVVNEQLVPAKGTPVRVTLKALPKDKLPKLEEGAAREE